MLPRIAIIAQRFGLIGGGERFAKEVTERIAAMGRYEIHVFANSWDSQCDRIIFHRVPKVKFPRFLRPWFFSVLTGRLIGKGNFDLVHSHWGSPHADVYSTHGAPHAFWMRDVLKRRAKLIDRMMIALERRMMASGTNKVFMPVSAHLQRAYEAEYGSLPGSWKVVHPGVDVESFAQVDRSSARSQVRDQFGIASDALVVLFVGMNFESKGLEQVIRAAGLIRKKYPTSPVHVLVVGRGNEAKFAQIAANVACADRVTFAGAQREGMERIYAAADLLALPASFETFCMVVLEGMASGLPVIITEQMGVKDIVQDGVHGFVLRDGAGVDGLAKCIETLSDSQTRLRMGQAASETAQAHGWDRVAGEICTIYDKFVTTSNGQRKIRR